MLDYNIQRGFLYNWKKFIIMSKINLEDYLCKDKIG